MFLEALVVSWEGVSWGGPEGEEVDHIHCTGTAKSAEMSTGAEPFEGISISQIPCTG